MQTEVTSEDAAPAPVVAYYAEAPRPLLPVVRGIGVLCIVFGFIELAALYCQLSFNGYRNTATVLAYERLVQVSQIVGYCVAVMVTVGYMAAGCGCLSRKPWGRRILLACAWIVLVWTAYAVGLTTCSYIKTFSGRYPAGYLASILGYQLKYLISGIGFPSLLILLMRNSEVRRVFSDPNAL
jgi:hypothetical protein